MRQASERRTKISREAYGNWLAFPPGGGCLMDATYGVRIWKTESSRAGTLRC